MKRKKKVTFQSNNMVASRTFITALALGLFFGTANGQAKTSMSFEEYDPVSTLVVPNHMVRSARFPFIDIHNHQPEMERMDLNLLLKQMDSLNMTVMVNLTGKGGAALKQMMDNINRTNKKRLIVFTNINFNGLGDAGWTKKTLAQLETDVANGAKGLKVFKELGMFNKDIDGKRIPVNDPRLDPIWDKCGELGIPVLIHSAAPASFWDAPNEKNERWLEMTTQKGRMYTNDNPASWQTIIDEQHQMFKKHPKTTFINAHFGWYANDLNSLSALLDEIPNMYIEFGAVIAELGRQPRMARQFFEKYQDRILFGKDSWVPREYVTYFRVLETDDEYFPYHKKYHAFWSMYGMSLPDAILKKIYYKNALKLLPSIDKTMFPE
jgi:predicted TIM-barrel fold metal-dependent hydrolase